MNLQVYCGKLYGFWCFLRLFTSVRFYRGGDFKGAMLSFLKVKMCLVFIEFQKNNVSVFSKMNEYRTSCGKVSYCQQQQSYSGLRSPGRSYSTYL